MKKETNKSKNDGYGSQMRLSLLNLAGELPNFFALLFSALSTKAVLVFVDLIDTGGNVMRNILVVLISKKLRKDLRYQYNYGVGKIEAMASMLCDFVMVLSLLAMLGFAVKDLILPRPAEGFMLFAVAVKVVNVLGDIFMYVKQRKLCRTSDSLVFRSALSVAFKNLVFDLTSLSALILMGIFGNVRVIWYLSPVVSLLLGGYLLFTTVKRLGETFGVMLDKSPDETVQRAILQSLTALYERYDAVADVQSRISGGTVIVDLDLGFAPELTYREMKQIADDFYAQLSSRVPKCQVSLRIAGTERETVAPEKTE